MKETLVGIITFFIGLYFIYSFFVLPNNIKKYNPKYDISNLDFFEFHYLTDSIYKDSLTGGIRFVHKVTNKEYILVQYKIQVLRK